MDRASQEGACYLRYALRADLFCLGERLRGALFRPCLKVFTYTALVGALKARFPRPFRRIHAVGRFLDDPEDPAVNAREILTFSPRDRGRACSTVPLEIEYLSNVRAEVFVERNDFSVTWPHEFLIRLGAMKSKGFGQCWLTRIGTIPRQNPTRGVLACRMPEDQAVKGAFSIRNVLHPVYGYLFQPATGGTGYYVRSLFEGSVLVADPVLLEREGGAP